MSSRLEPTTLHYWQARLRNLPLEPPVPHDSDSTSGAAQSWATVNFGEDTSLQLLRLAAALAVDVDDVAIGLWLLLLWRYRVQAPLVCCTYVDQSQQFPLQVRFEPDTSIAQALQRVISERHQSTDMALSPTDLLTLAQQQNLDAMDLWGRIGYVVGDFDLPVDSPLGLLLQIQPTQAEIRLQYRSEGIAPAMVSRLAQHYAVLLAAAVGDGEQSIATVNYLTASELDQLRHQWNSSPQDYPRTWTIHDWFEYRVTQNPQAIALIDGDQAVTYEELNARSNQLAHYLRNLGVQPDQLVGVALDRSINLFVAFLGVLKSGAAYVSLDPSYAQERRAYTLNDAQAQLVLTQESLLSLIPQTAAPVIPLDRDWSVIDQYSPNNPVAVATPDNLAYVLYTSGSTGNPKGVMIQHGGLVNHAAAVAREFAIQPNDRMLQFCNIGFDIIVEELYPTLVSGATLVLRPESIASSMRDFWDFVERQKITLLDLPTAFWHEVVNSLVTCDRVFPKSVRLVCVGGEKASRTAYAQWKERVAPQVRWLNTYGPTETTVSATWCDPDKDGYTLDMGEVPIGLPLANYEVYVLDERQQLLPVGIPGELCIGGPGVARGYLNLPEKTAERFIANPFNADPQARLYRTGDVVQFCPDGMLEFIGRSDFQVKIRGFRVELGEIEAKLEEHPQVRQTVLLAQERANRKVLIAYVVPQVGVNLDAKDLGHWLQERLPNYMIPSQFIVLDALPLTPNGKVDRKALPEPAISSRETAGFQPPADALEMSLVRLWEEILGVPVDVTDNFFELGGHSLLVVRLCDQIEQTLHSRVSPMALFRSPTIQQLARQIRQDVTENDAQSSAVVIQAGAETHYPLFAIHVLGEGGRFFRPLAQNMGLEQPVYGLAAQMMDTDTAPPNRVEDLAAFYINEMQLIQSEGPYHIVGMSYGGIIAYEMARQMERLGLPIGLVGLLDTYGPNQIENLPSGDRLKAHWRSACAQGRRRYLKHKIRSAINRRTEKLHCAYGGLRQKMGRQVSYELQYKMIIAENVRAADAYHPGPFGGRLSLFRATDAVFYPPAYLESGLGWRNLAGQLDIYDVPGCHMTMVEEPQAQSLAGEMCRAMSQVAGSSQTSRAPR
ncbi:amino acid adenylation domain-containing protein [filamentous cyanobacterium LEGE 11480]|uniref:Amino acid adenylation domain-containing protein n=1 Tax=Romeriopsis navalis LEGE 11480 TaxID=2777977 RepID=A0A928VPW3_9CYAN|nr:amino acid adenylation domain-containing protein [Romeriopsis navalis]MBE9031628.1 amino acid adenylation domain-containing protein [Romeriopsis navalis LEGE 11480]